MNRFVDAVNCSVVEPRIFLTWERLADPDIMGNACIVVCCLEGWWGSFSGGEPAGDQLDCSAHPLAAPY